MLALSQMGSGHRSQLADVTVEVSDDPFAYMYTCAHRATLRHFDSKVGPPVKYGPLIPWIRRLAKTEISEFQELTFGARFGNRDYGRPYGRFLVTLHGFD